VLLSSFILTTQPYVAKLGPLILLSIAATFSAPPVAYRVIGRFDVSQLGDTYLIDASHRRLYGASNDVIDVDRYSVVATFGDSVPNVNYAIASQLNRVAARSRLGLDIFDLTTSRLVGRTSGGADAAVWDPVTKLVFFMGDIVTVVDLEKSEVISRLPLPGAKETAVADGHGRVYANLILEDSIAVIDSRAVHLERKIGVAPCKSPRGMAMDYVHRRLFVTCIGMLAIVDPDSSRVVATVSVPGRLPVDQDTFDSGSGLIFLPTDPGIMTIVHEDSPDRYSVVQHLSLPDFTTNQAVVDERTHHVFWPCVRDHTTGFLVLGQ
jgi:hypothetical protein